MATVLLTWELGSGLAHLMNLAALAKGLRRRGHRVFAALRELSGAEEVFGDLGVSYLQAPCKRPGGDGQIRMPRCAAHLLHDVGFGAEGQLRPLVDAWQNLYAYVQPDVILFEHSPTALLAARSSQARGVVVGNGFCCPPDAYPLPDLRPWMPPCPESLKHDEDHVLGIANQVLTGLGQPAMERLAQLYQDVEERLLVTLEEFDHYRDRKDAVYRGVWQIDGGAAPQWPEGDGKRVLVYLKPCPALESVLAKLVELGLPTIVCGGLERGWRERFQAKTLRFQSERLDLRQVTAGCDLAVLNGNHGTTLSMLLAGKPTMHAPLSLEQSINAISAARLNAALVAAPEKPQQVVERLTLMLTMDRFGESARRFAGKYAGFSSKAQLESALDRIEELMN